MKKAVKVVFVVIFLVSVLSVNVFASESEDFWNDFVEIAPGESVPENIEDSFYEVGVESLFAELISAFGEGVSEISVFIMMLIGLAVIISVADTASPFEGSSLSRHASSATVMISALIIFNRIGSLCYSVRDSLAELSAFFTGLIPVLTGILAAGGNIASASAQAVNMNITLGALSYVGTSMLVPLVFSLFALALAGSVGGGTVSSVAKSVRGIFMWIMGISTTIIIGAVSMQSLITGAQDSAYLRAAKYAATGMIPVVGSTVSSALATLAGGLGYVKSAVGVSAVVVIVGLVISPLITLLLYRLAFSIGISFLEFTGASGGVKMYSAFKSALDTLISVYVLSSVIYICEIVVFMRCGADVFG